MKQIEISKLSDEQMEELGISSWPVWSKEPSVFDWYYDTIEECYILEGEADVTTKDGKKVTFGAGDFVRFPKGLGCTWHVRKAVRKHYRFL